ncbi:MAG TPA: glycoside hydrolase family 3 N-terminal domain-containing protein [Solirubrobacteraceae bacterium]
MPATSRPAELRRAAAAAALLVVTGGTGCGGAAATRSDPLRAAAAPPAQARAAVDRLTLRQQIGQTVILSFGGTAPPAYVTRALRERRAAGAILFGGNVASPGQLRALTSSLQRAAGGRALVMTDQEGGPIRIVPFAAPDAGERAQGSPAAARAQAARAAHDLRALGINVTLTPVADVPSVAGAAIAGRAFAGAAPGVAARVGAAVRAYGAAGVGATAKHFPGFGGATVNTDEVPVTISSLSERDLLPFKAAIAAGAPLVMVSHALYPNLDPRRIASQSPAIMRGLLRDRLHFSGVIVTDSMEAAAVTRRSSIEVAAERALRAGADLLLLTGDGSFRPVSLDLAAVARHDPALRARIREAAARVLALQLRLRAR